MVPATGLCMTFSRDFQMLGDWELLSKRGIVCCVKLGLLCDWSVPSHIKKIHILGQGSTLLCLSALDYVLRNMESLP